MCNMGAFLEILFYYLLILSFQKVQDTLRDHAVLVREPITAQPVSVQSHKTNYNTAQVWKRIYTNPSLYTE